MNQKHNSQRGYFAYELYHQMKKNKDIFLLLGDLGYKVFDQHRADFPERCINVGAAEHSMMAMAVGLALSGKVPFVYSITPFLLYRSFEIIRTYINYENIAVKMIGSGRDKDYEHDGMSHWAHDDKRFMRPLKSIDMYHPEQKETINEIFLEMIIESNRPVYLNLTR